MRTFFYFLDTGEIGDIREGRYMVDGEPGWLPDNIIEIEYLEDDAPIYDQSLQTIERNEYLDINQKKFFVTYTIRDLTQQEIEDRKPRYDDCTPRQFRLALLDYGIDPDTITNMINQISDVDERKRVLITWEYAVLIEKNNPLIINFAQLMGVDQSGIEEIFRLANQYD